MYCIGGSSNFLKTSSCKYYKKISKKTQRFRGTYIKVGLPKSPNQDAYVRPDSVYWRSSGPKPEMCMNWVKVAQEQYQ